MHILEWINAFVFVMFFLIWMIIEIIAKSIELKSLIKQIVSFYTLKNEGFLFTSVVLWRHFDCFDF